jgi:Na+/H+ antiporter NhaD/arsenite permease-like protein
MIRWLFYLGLGCVFHALFYQTMFDWNNAWTIAWILAWPVMLLPQLLMALGGLICAILLNVAAVLLFIFIYEKNEQRKARKNRGKTEIFTPERF